jgi:aryl-alcohol dehydrogenase-like predicted oxidoreductase
MMEFVTLGKTGLQVSVLGLGGGGHSRLGQQTGATEDESTAIVRRALELGVNFIDTAEAYGTEAIVGAALAGVRRQDFILSTKKSISNQGRLITAAELAAGLDASLARLQTDYVDIYHLHGVRPEQYDQAVAELMPAMQRLREAGKIRFLGITEAFGSDTGHRMLARAVREDDWDVVMVGFNMLNQSARERVLSETLRRGIGVLCMFAVRDALSRPDKLRETIGELAKQGLIDQHGLDLQNPLGFVEQVAESLPDAAYRFCRAEPGMHVILSGTGKRAHLEQNVASILRPPLPEHIRARLIDMFARVDTVSGQ